MFHKEINFTLCFMLCLQCSVVNLVQLNNFIHINAAIHFRNSPNPNLGSSPAANKSFEFPAGMGGTGSLAYPSPHLPPYPTPTLIQPVAQLRQPYIVTITNSVTIPGNR